MSDESMVERVADALKAGGLREDWDVCIALARAAITAMREPSEAMIDAFCVQRGMALIIAEQWRKIIDEALK